jgi:hypothetical protein
MGRTPTKTEDEKKLSKKERDKLSRQKKKEEAEKKLRAQHEERKRKAVSLDSIPSLDEDHDSQIKGTEENNSGPQHVENDAETYGTFEPAPKNTTGIYGKMWRILRKLHAFFESDFKYRRYYFEEKINYGDRIVDNDRKVYEGCKITIRELISLILKTAQRSSDGGNDSITDLVNGLMPGDKKFCANWQDFLDTWIPLPMR